jgi:hypothetical protein
VLDPTTPAEDEAAAKTFDLGRSLEGVTVGFRLDRSWRSYFVVLMGTDRNDARYIGALDRNWRVIHTLNCRTGQAPRQCYGRSKNSEATPDESETV